MSAVVRWGIGKPTKGTIEPSNMPPFFLPHPLYLTTLSCSFSVHTTQGGNPGPVFPKDCVSCPPVHKEALPTHSLQENGLSILPRSQFPQSRCISIKPPVYSLWFHQVISPINIP